MKTYQQFSTRATPQSEPIPNSDQVQNSAGGFSWSVDKWQRLERFLILGTEGGSYYASERKLTKENAQTVIECVKEDGIRTVNIIVEISEAGRAPKNDPALFALAICTAPSIADVATRKYALESLPRVARIGTHLFHFAAYVEQFRGWGRLLRNAIANWYQNKEPKKLSYQVVKYQQRDGWSHRDLLRLSKPVPQDNSHNAIYSWVTKGEADIAGNDDLLFIEGFERAQQADTEKQIVGLINTYNLTREMIPTQFLNSVAVWDALLQNMPLTAMVRNLGKMTEVGLIKPMSNPVNLVQSKLNNEAVKKSRIHPLQVLTAMKVYGQGHGMRGSLAWEPVSQIVDALDDAFYMSFENVEPTGKRMALCLDVSGSMAWVTLAGMPLTPRDGSAAMAMVTARTEQQYHIVGFSHELVKLAISPRQRLDDVVGTISNLDFGRTDCALPMINALNHKIEVDTFVVYTDSETWFGNIHPAQALEQYRQQMGINAKLVVVGMVSNGFTIADPNDAGMLDVVGFDTATPQAISEFVKM